MACTCHIEFQWNQTRIFREQIRAATPRGGIRKRLRLIERGEHFRFCYQGSLKSAEKQSGHLCVAGEGDRYIIGGRLRTTMNPPPTIPGVAASSIDGELVLGFWDPALPSEEIRGHALATLKRLQVPPVIARVGGGKVV